jgi:predicted dehydrogenase
VKSGRSPLGIGVVGTGALSLRGTLPHLAEEDVRGSVRVVAVCDPVIARASAVAEQYEIPAAYPTIEEMLADPAIDAVTISSPIGLHFDHVSAALTAGKHVHVNKTMCTALDEANRLIDMARKRSLALIASPGEILRPQLDAIRKLVNSGAIGELSWALCGGSFGGYHERDEQVRTDAPGGTSINPAWYFRKPGGGPMYDITSYSLHQLTSVLGPALRVSALSGIAVKKRWFEGRSVPTEADDNTVLLLDFGGARFVVVHGTAAGAVSEQFGATVYYGTRGTLDGVLLNGDPIDFVGREATTDRPVTDWDAQMRVLPHVTGAHQSIPESHVFEDVMQMVDEVTTGRTSRVTPEQARHVIEIIEVGYAAAASGRTHDLTTSFELP